MNQRIKELWVEKLRSNPSLQTQKCYMRKDGTRDVIGILFEVLAEQAPHIFRITDMSELPYQDLEITWDNIWDNYCKGPRITILKSYLRIDPNESLHESLKIDIGEKKPVQLTELNDKGKTFLELADLIETKL